ncbi:MAG TPA: tetratricopeptide repeat protein [Ohtaekwangia sp.]|nr:tetratricopeptide repeat protein [Ohtaekwangia sp.]
MKYILVSMLVLGLITDPMKIGKINKAKSAAQEAYNSGNFKTAIQQYRYLVDSLQVTEDEILLNLANAYYLTKDTAQAYSGYQSLAGSTNNTVRSKAQQQLGIMHHKQGKLEEALNNFKQSIKADPANMDARYNYEMLKKKLDEQKKQEEKQQQNKDQNKDQKQDQQKKDQQNKEQEKKDQQQKDQEKKDQEQKDQQQKEQDKKEQQQKEQQQKDQQDKEQKDKEQQQKQNEEQKEDQKKEKKDLPPQVSEKLQDMKISEEKAKMILEAMKNQEVQYLQQNKRKATKPRDKGKPDW